MATSRITPLQAEVLELLAYGYSVPEIAQRKRFTRQRAQEIIGALRIKGLLAEEPASGTTTRITPWPPPPRWARWDPFVLRSATLAREDGAELPEAAPNELALVWTHIDWPPQLGWSRTAPRRRRWAIADTKDTYADWRRWVAIRGNMYPAGRTYVLAELDNNALHELTQTIAWVLDTEAVLLIPQQDDSAAATTS